MNTVSVETYEKEYTFLKNLLDEPNLNRVDIAYLAPSLKALAMLDQEKVRVFLITVRKELSLYKDNL